MEVKESPPSLIAVPYDQLSEATLRGVIQSFVLREGTDYGSQEFTLDQKVDHVLQQLKRSEVAIVFDPKEETFDIRSKSKLQKLGYI